MSAPLSAPPSAICSSAARPPDHRSVTASPGHASRRRSRAARRRRVVPEPGPHARPAYRWRRRRPRPRTPAPAPGARPRRASSPRGSSPLAISVSRAAARATTPVGPGERAQRQQLAVHDGGAQQRRGAGRRRRTRPASASSRAGAASRGRPRSSSGTTPRAASTCSRASTCRGARGHRSTRPPSALGDPQRALQDRIGDRAGAHVLQVVRMRPPARRWPPRTRRLTSAATCPPCRRSARCRSAASTRSRAVVERRPRRRPDRAAGRADRRSPATLTADRRDGRAKPWRAQMQLGSGKIRAGPITADQPLGAARRRALRAATPRRAPPARTSVRPK